MMRTTDKLIRLLQATPSAGGGDLARKLGISRQALNRHIQSLLRTERIVRIGETRGATYRLASKNASAQKGKKLWRRFFLLQGLEEHHAFEELVRTIPLQRLCRANVYEILHYAFTEMLNNAIDHSKSKKCLVFVEADSYEIRFTIRDWGIGVFHSIASHFRLAKERDAIGELIKGKTTTMKEKHSGEGIFFTSKAADRLSFRSHQFKLTFDNEKKDLFVSDVRSLKGTEVAFSIRRRSSTDLKKVFGLYAPPEGDYQFDRTSVNVKLFQSAYVSRSEAKRLLAGLDKFRGITLDFKGVHSIGQGFADEIFRVFANAQPNITINWVRASPAVEAMVRHVVDNKKK